jgi:putative tryptophan/tyrosine transport system substrate-binding protein
MNRAQRRKFLLASSALLTVPLSSFAQKAEKVRRIEYLSGSTLTSFVSLGPKKWLWDSLRRAGYEEGKNLIIEMRFADGKLERLAALAEELARLNIELIIASLNPAIAAAKQATRTIPIVMHAALNPVENGYVASLARPGGNITGTKWAGPEVAGKIVQILKEAVPGAVRIANLLEPNYPAAEAWTTERDRAAGTLGMSLQDFPITRVDDVVGALDHIAAIRPDALIVWGGPILNSRGREIAAFATQRKLVSVGATNNYVEAGGLIFYGPDLSAVFDRTASYVDRILRGAKPADLPVEGPTKYELVINTKTAQAIAFKPPQSFLVGVDRQIE